MAETVKKMKTVKVKLPLTRTEKDDVFVGLNGKTYLIKRGVEVAVPVGVAKILERREKMLSTAHSITGDLVDVFRDGLAGQNALGDLTIPTTAAINASYNFTAANRQPIIVISQLDGKAVGYGVANYVTRQQNFTERSRNAW
jgi:hypothetical protein